MNVENLSHDEMEMYYKNPDLLTAHAKKIRTKLIVELITGFTGRISSIFKYWRRKGLPVLKNKTQSKKLRISAS